MLVVVEELRNGQCYKYLNSLTKIQRTTKTVLIKTMVFLAGWDRLQGKKGKKGVYKKGVKTSRAVAGQAENEVISS